MGIVAKELKCEYSKNPIGLDMKRPSFSWILEGNKSGIMQTAYHIRVVRCNSSLKKEKTVWDSGKVESDDSIHIVYAGQDLESTTSYCWTVKVWDNYGDVSEECEEAYFETAFLSPDNWTAKWIEPKQEPAALEQQIDPHEAVKNDAADPDTIDMKPCQYIRKDIAIDRIVSRARVYATAHGIYTLFLDGEKISDIEFAPDNTTYHEYLQYQTYDITDKLTKGEHTIGAILADGWYCGRVGATGDSCQYGNMLGLLLQLEIEYTDGTKMIVDSDASFKSTMGPLIYSDIFVGEKYDATKELKGWAAPGYDDSNWKITDEVSQNMDNLTAQYGEPVRICNILRPKNIYISPKGETIVDFGQVMAGRVSFKVKNAEEGTRITLEHSEIVDQEANFLNNILGRYKNQTDTYICCGASVEVYEPLFTFHGFRYVRITGYPGNIEDIEIEAHVLHSDMVRTGEFECSDSRLNQLQHNIFWSQISNMLSIPTDCPQREKAGWTGDAQVFAPTASYNMNVAPFFKRWLRNVEKDQLPDGEIPNVVPYLKAYHPDVLPLGMDTHCSAGWGDVATILPWTLFNAYGEKAIIEEHYQMMKGWVSYIIKTAANDNPDNLGEVTAERAEHLKYLWNTHFHFGDWLTPSVSFDFETGDVDMMQSAYKTMDLVPSFFYAYSTELLSKMASLIGNEADAENYRKISLKVREAFIYEYVDGNGYIKTNLQGIYVLALKMRMVPEELRENTLNKLIDMIKENGNKLDTGFLSAPFLLEVLQEDGRIDLAYDLLFQDECPSWLYEVKMGATTMWEAWQAVFPDGKPTAVSYNHYAFGCVGDWMYKNIAGINATSPGYKSIAIRPELDDRITFAKGSLKTMYGKVISDWKIENDTMTFHIVIPANTTAEIYLPKAELKHVSEAGNLINNSEKYDAAQVEGKVRCKVGSGEYCFRYALL